MRRWHALLFTALVLLASALACSRNPALRGARETPATFYVDCAVGNDAFSGRSQAQPWRTLARAAQAQLHPGDQLLLRRGCTFDEPLRAAWRGTEAAPVLIGSYGEGARPRLTRPAANGAIVEITGQHLVVEHLEVSAAAHPPPDSRPDCPTGWRVGFSLTDASHVTLRHVRASALTAGVFVDEGSSHNRVTHSELVDNTYLSVNTPGGDDDSGAFGVLLNGDHNVVSHNLFAGNAAFCSFDYGQDGASVEIFGGSHNLIHHNVSYDLAAFVELGSLEGRVASHNTLAYNLYVNRQRGEGDFLIVRGHGEPFGPTPHTRALNNTVYMAPRYGSGVVCMACSPSLLTLTNNILWVEGTAIYADAPFAESHNLVWSSGARPRLELHGFALDRSSRVADPRLRDPQRGDFTPTSDSPARASGARWPLHSALAVDLAGQPLPDDGQLDVGAFSYRELLTQRSNR
ncbi:hypothetical protein [Truepera radiovictrix]|uniref:Right handed beta helix domain-containing protein n=1 Tax=Truepera radiovictrix (strain DSM 17093 / CIP 108686 / LMG 22925 / RQ-24) TaxID=649638 RepID=D7CSD1_TRURR|nr:hypothetical protein [Truepera radiovictrix]ADI13663.1 hypothetical protein Trad_0526 [Truepera radiovictrix DSM 17093]WMT57775.1 hypothetical protein RCV51_02225 [Truepera radiovictrix]